MKKTLVIGASPNPSRYAYVAINRLLDKGIEVVALGRRAGMVGDVEIQTTKKLFQGIHTVTLYIGPQHQPEFYDFIIELKPHRVIFNPGTENPEFYQILRKKNIEAEVACTLVLLGTNQY